MKNSWLCIWQRLTLTSVSGVTRFLGYPFQKQFQGLGPYFSLYKNDCTATHKVKMMVGKKKKVGFLLMVYGAIHIHKHYRYAVTVKLKYVFRFSSHPFMFPLTQKVKKRIFLKRVFIQIRSAGLHEICNSADTMKNYT